MLLEGLLWLACELSPEVWEESSTQGHLFGHSAEETHGRENRTCLWAVLLLCLSEPCLLLFSLWDLSLCLEEALWSLVSYLSGCSFTWGEHFVWQDDFLPLVESGTQGEEPLRPCHWSCMIPPLCWRNSTHSLGCGEIFLGGGRWGFLLPVS